MVKEVVVIPDRDDATRRKRSPTVVFVVSEDWYFISHRRELAAHLNSLGWRVIVATQVNSPAAAERIRSSGFCLEDVALHRGSLSIASDLMYCFKLLQIYRKYRPDIVHHVAMKPVLYGSVAALCVPKTAVLNALPGLGYVFTSPRISVRVIRGFVSTLFRHLFARDRTRIVVQNTEDARVLRTHMRVDAAKVRLIRGSGVDPGRFRSVRHGARQRPVITMVSRMLRDKGVVELVEAARLLRERGVNSRILLVGGVDNKNPNSLSEGELKCFDAEGVVEWLGARADVADIYAGTDIAVLPSYREGLPKSLLEAAASGLPIVTTDTSGCREVVHNGINGLLVPVRDPLALADALMRLIRDPSMREAMGRRSRIRVESEFSQAIVNEQTAEVYRELFQFNRAR